MAVDATKQIYDIYEIIAVKCGWSIRQKIHITQQERNTFHKYMTFKSKRSDFYLLKLLFIGFWFNNSLPHSHRYTSSQKNTPIQSILECLTTRTTVNISRMAHCQCHGMAHGPLTIYLLVAHGSLPVCFIFVNQCNNVDIPQFHQHQYPFLYQNISLTKSRRKTMEG